MKDQNSLLELVTDSELDEAAEVTLVMSAKELQAILAIDAAHAIRDEVYTRPTVAMPVVKIT